MPAGKWTIVLLKVTLCKGKGSEGKGERARGKGEWEGKQDRMESLCWVGECGDVKEENDEEEA